VTGLGGAGSEPTAEWSCTDDGECEQSARVTWLAKL
jgi:hypothetical protein